MGEKKEGLAHEETPTLDKLIYDEKSELELIFGITDLSNMKKDVLEKAERILIYNDYRIVQNNILDLSKLGEARLKFWITQFENRNDELWGNSDAFGFIGMLSSISIFVSTFGIISKKFYIAILIMIAIVSFYQSSQIRKKQKCKRVLFFLNSALELVLDEAEENSTS